VYYGEVQANVHGGLTFSGPCDESGHICHVARAGEPDEVWWQGFDCAHGFDYLPIAESWFGLGEFDALRPCYRDVAYVREQVERLAQQAAEAGK